ncbi:MAG: hypothetical protein HQL01_09975 [Nitrospirae bacterium]|nr:hypothetical protein [Nitrospirota bacterium]
MIITAGTTLISWLAILVSVIEIFNDNNTRENHIYAYTASVLNYPGGTINWTYNFTGVTWDNITSPAAGYQQSWPSSYNYNSISNPYIIDSSLSTTYFSAILPPEIGLHSYYDSGESLYFVDFAMCYPGGAAYNVLEYY